MVVAWSVVDGVIRREVDGPVFMATGINGGAPIATAGMFSGPPGSYVAWAQEGYPGNFQLYTDPWPGDANLAPPTNVEVFPGGLLNGGVYWSQGSNNGSGAFVELPDRAYALTQVRSEAAKRLGIGEVQSPWCPQFALYRINAHLVSGPDTWSGTTLTADDTIPQYVARVQELLALDAGLVVAIENHDQTGTDPTIHPNLVNNPIASLSEIGTYSATLRDSAAFYDALARAFQGNGHDVWIGLPNEAWTTGYLTNLANDATLSTNYRNWVLWYAKRIRAMGFGGILTIPTGRWAGELGPLSRGKYDDLIAELETQGLGPIVWEEHEYGADYPEGVGAAGVDITHSALVLQLEACRAKGIPVWFSEVGKPIPTPGDALSLRAAIGVEVYLGSTYGTPVAELFPETCAVVWAAADNSFNVKYALTKGEANKANEQAADPNAVGAHPGVYPWWDVTTQALEDEWCTSTGKYLRRLGRAVRALYAAQTVPEAEQPPTDLYATVGEVKRELRLTTTVDDERILAAVTAASRMIDNATRRRFSGVAGGRVFRTWGVTALIDDAQSVTLVEESTDQVTWSTVAATAYAPNPRPPIRRLDRLSGAPWLPFVRVTATWGTSTIPAEIHTACLIQAVRLFKRADTPEGVLVGDFGAARLARIDPDVLALVRPLARKVVG